MSQNVRNTLPICTMRHPRRVKTSTTPQSKPQITISSSYISKFNVHKLAIMWENSFKVALLFTRVMMRETVNLRSGHFKKKIISCSVMSCTHLTWASMASPINLLLSPVIAGFCTEGFRLKALHRFVFHLIFLNICLYSHWQHTITAFHSVDNLAVHFGHTSSALTPQPIRRPNWTSYPTFARNFWEPCCWAEEED